MSEERCSAWTIGSTWPSLQCELWTGHAGSHLCNEVPWTEEAAFYPVVPFCCRPGMTPA